MDGLTLLIPVAVLELKRRAGLELRGGEEPVCYHNQSVKTGP